VQSNAREVWQNYVSCNGGFSSNHREYRRAYLINVMLLAAMSIFILFTLLNITYFHLFHVAIIDFLAFVGACGLVVPAQPQGGGRRPDYDSNYLHRTGGLSGDGKTP